MSATRPTVLKRGVAETVIGGALVAVLENVIRLVHFLEAVLAVLVVGIAVRVVLHGELAERRLELALIGGPRHAEHFVVAALRHVLPPKKKTSP
jgi:hypothetical protein